MVSGFAPFSRDRRERWEREAYNEAMGRPLAAPVPRLYAEGVAALQWDYKMPGRKPGHGTWTEFMEAFTNGAKAPRKRQAQLPPLERITKARRARTRAENELQAAIKAARDSHTLQEIATVLGVSRQRVSQILSV